MSGESLQSEANKRFVRLDSEEVYDALELHVISSRENYIHTLCQGTEQLINSEDVLKKLGIILHHYADRVFNNGDIRQKYHKDMKMLGIDEDAKAKVLGQIHNVLQANKLLFNRASLEAIDSLRLEQVESIFNYAFNDKISLPEGINLNTTQDATPLLTIFSKALDIYLENCIHILDSILVAKALSN